MKKFVVIGNVAIIPEEVKAITQEESGDIYLSHYLDGENIPFISRLEGITVEEAAKILNDYFEEKEKEQSKGLEGILDIFKKVIDVKEPQEETKEDVQKNNESDHLINSHLTFNGVKVVESNDIVGLKKLRKTIQNCLKVTCEQITASKEEKTNLQIDLQTVNKRIAEVEKPIKGEDSDLLE